MIELLRKRRSVRQYTDKPVEKEKRDILSEALLRSPSSRGRNPWEFILVDDRENIAKLAEAKKHGSSFAKDAGLIYVITGDRDMSDMCVEDCSIAAVTLHYTAVSLGLGSCWIQLREREKDERTKSEDYVRRLLGIPDSYLVLAMVAIGYAAETPEPHPDNYLQKHKIRLNRF
ncbi:NAD(P)H-dependent dehydrogenase/reductase [Geovibrio thiophilus]|uniref:NAD(P)H-dependent dehydrogenase/reductase n=1 Tax=Geovibrio thiophilus TaxID=139438 RepID=A0A410K0Q6_9BACT|nr:nitroreductase family protein [Geovibrio thiophilus]QAR33969.1 NAD(P)H-dependent dehydrogenase/reductase [Geovibrio thiophilus]